MVWCLSDAAVRDICHGRLRTTRVICKTCCDDAWQLLTNSGSHIRTGLPAWPPEATALDKWTVHISVDFESGAQRLSPILLILGGVSKNDGFVWSAHLSPLFLELRSFFSGSSICSSSGWHQSASRVVATRDRGKGCDMVLSTLCKQARPQSTPASSIMQVSPLWLSGHGEREKEPNVGFLVLSAANPVLGPDSPSWEQDLIVLRTHRSLLVVDGQTQNNGNYPDCCDQDTEAQICENNFKRIAGAAPDEVHYFAEENISSVAIL